MRKRKGKKTDQEEIEKAYQFLLELVKNHPEIEETLWAAALMSAFVNMYKETGCSYMDFCSELENMKFHYQSWWEDKKD